MAAILFLRRQKIKSAKVALLVNCGVLQIAQHSWGTMSPTGTQAWKTSHHDHMKKKKSCQYDRKEPLAFLLLVIRWHWERRILRFVAALEPRYVVQNSGYFKRLTSSWRVYLYFFVSPKRNKKLNWKAFGLLLNYDGTQIVKFVFFLPRTGSPFWFASFPCEQTVRPPSCVLIFSIPACSDPNRISRKTATPWVKCHTLSKGLVKGFVCITNLASGSRRWGDTFN